MLPPIDWHMCARESSTTPDTSRLQTFQHFGDCLRSESSCGCKYRHTCSSLASCIWMAYSYKASTARETEPNNLCTRDRGLLACQCLACARTTEVVVSQQDGGLHWWSNLYFWNAFGKTVGLTYRVECDEPSEKRFEIVWQSSGGSHEERQRSGSIWLKPRSTTSNLMWRRGGGWVSGDLREIQASVSRKNILHTPRRSAPTWNGHAVPLS